MNDRHVLTRRELLKRAALYTPVVYAALSYPRLAQGAAIVAANASQASVQAAVNAAQNGDTVLIPNGSATWSSPLNIGGKRIIIRAQNYTPTSVPGPGVTRNVTITYTGTSGQAMTFNSGNDFHCGVGGIRFNPPNFGQQGGGSGVWGFVHFTGAGNKPPLMFDCYIAANERQNVSSGEAAFLSIDSQGAVIWNTLFDGTTYTGPSGGGGTGMSGSGIHMSSPRAWTTASTMGTLDIGGLVNVYFEDCHLLGWGQADSDDNARFVVRRSIMNGSSWQHHGFTSAVGGRHAELYDNQLINNLNDRNHNRYFWLRAGTALFTGNFVSNQNTGYGTPSLLDVGDNTSPSGSYPVNRGPGRGHNGTAHVGDPVYIWNNTGGAAQSWDVDPVWAGQFQLNRDVFVSGVPGNAKPSTPGSPVAWARFTYPHPLRSVVEDGAAPTPAPVAPTGLTIG